MRILTLCIALSFTLLSTAQEIPWQHGVDLSWEDFQQRVGQGGVFKAYTYSGIRYEVRDKNGKIAIEVHSYFLADESWAFKDFLTEALLQHEQYHFHITEIYARKMEQAFAKFEVDIDEFMDNRMMREVRRTFDRIYDEMEAKQKEYDKATDHGILKGEQNRWVRWVDKELDL